MPITERCGLMNRAEVDILHNHYLDVLAYQIQRTHSSNSGRILIKLFKLLPLLDIIAQKQLQVVATFKPESPPGWLTLLRLTYLCVCVSVFYITLKAERADTQT